MEKIRFVTLAGTEASVIQAKIFTESLRRFGGEMGRFPFMLMMPDSEDTLSDAEKQRFDGQGVQLSTFNRDEEPGKFPFATLVQAASAAETRAEGVCEILVWMLPDTLVLNPPKVFLLPEGTRLAYRPVHHTLVGSIYDQPVDPFWTLIYEHCDVPQDRIFPMETCVRDHIIRPYFNAGMLAVRPQNGLFSDWWNMFQRLYRHPDFLPFYEKDRRYAIFMHQAVLTGVLLHRLTKGEMQELPETVNYPLHLHHEYPPEHRPKTLNALITCRYERLDELPGFLKNIQVEDPLSGWISKRTGME